MDLSQQLVRRAIRLPAPAIKVTKTFRPVAVTEPTKGTYIVDMGQNFGGWASFGFDVPAGTEITIRYGELLNKDGSLNPMSSVCGQIKSGQPQYPGAPPVAWQEDRYIARGGGENYTPQFTFHAFRYIELVGLPSIARFREGPADELRRRTRRQLFLLQ